MRSNVVSAVLLALSAFTGSAIAADMRYLDHNGSEMLMVVGDASQDVSAVTIYYSDPRDGMREQGVERGTLFFNGEIAWNSGLVAGTARIFRVGCEPLEYEVRGAFSGRRAAVGTLELHGPAPVYERDRCDQSHVAINRNSRLVFEPLTARGR